MTYMDRVNATSPTHFWTLRKTLSANVGGYNLTDFGTAIAYTAGPTDRVPGSFGADSSALELRNASLPSNVFSTAYTYGGWFRTDTQATDDALISNWTGTGGWMLQFPSATALAIYHNQVSSHAPSITLGGTGWRHLMAWWNGTTIRLYVDGKIYYSAAESGSLGSSVTFFNIGTYSNRSQSQVDGSAAYVGLWNMALTDAQIASLADYAPFSYQDVVVQTSDLVGYWPLNGSSVQAASDIVGGYHLTFTGSPTFEQSGIPYGGTSVKFNGSSQYGKTSDIGAIASADTTASMEFWFRSESTTTLRTMMTLRRDAGSTESMLAALNTPSDGNVRGHRAGAFRTAGAGSYNDDKWHHRVDVVNGSTYYVYIDGALLESGASANPSAGAPFVSIGSNYSGGGTQHFQGWIAHAAVYNRVLTETEIKMHYRMGIRGRAGITVY